MRSRSRTCIGTYEVTNAQYAEFLNAKAASDPLGLYNRAWPWARRHHAQRASRELHLQRDRRPRDMPVIFVSFYDALRFANWLNNGQGAGAPRRCLHAARRDGTPSNGATVTRNAGATIVLRARTSGTRRRTTARSRTSYFDYPAGSDTADDMRGADRDREPSELRRPASTTSTTDGQLHGRPRAPTAPSTRAGTSASGTRRSSLGGITAVLRGGGDLRRPGDDLCARHQSRVASSRRPTCHRVSRRDDPRARVRACSLMIAPARPARRRRPADDANPPGSSSRAAPRRTGPAARGPSAAGARILWPGVTRMPPPAWVSRRSRRCGSTRLFSAAVSTISPFATSTHRDAERARLDLEPDHLEQVAAPRRAARRSGRGARRGCRSTSASSRQLARRL